MSQKRVYLFGNGKAEGNAKMRCCLLLTASFCMALQDVARV